jgi:hypothetical protein
VPIKAGKARDLVPKRVAGPFAMFCKEKRSKRLRIIGTISKQNWKHESKQLGVQWARLPKRERDKYVQDARDNMDLKVASAAEAAQAAAEEVRSHTFCSPLQVCMCSLSHCFVSFSLDLTFRIER